MNNMNLLKPNNENLNLFLVLGSLFFTLGILDFSKLRLSELIIFPLSLFFGCTNSLAMKLQY